MLIYGEVDTIIYVSTIMKSDFWNLTPLYDANHYQRLVASITIMESLPIKSWAKGGELLLTSLKTLPENTCDQQALIDEMCSLSIPAIAVKCKQQDNQHPVLHQFVELAKECQIPIFVIPEDRTYLSLTNGVNLLLTKVDQQNTLKEYLLQYMLLSKNIHDDFIIKQCMQSLQIHIHGKSMQVFEFQLHNVPHIQEKDFTQSKQKLFLAIYAIFEQQKSNKKIHDYLYLRGEHSFHFAIIVGDASIMENIIEQLHNVLTMQKSVYIGVSTLRPYVQLKALFDESKFACKTGYVLKKQRMTPYAQVSLMRVISALADADQEAYFATILTPLRKHPFLLDTLIAYFRNNENQKATAEELYIHVNTLQYRLKKMETLTGLTFTNITDKMNVYIALISDTTKNWRKSNDND